MCTGMNENPYMMLAKFILPSEMTEHFDLTKVESDQFGGEQRLHLYLDEKDIKPEDKPGIKPIRKNKAFVPEKLSNGNTVPELLSRSHYL